MESPYSYLLSMLEDVPIEALMCIINSPNNKLFVQAVSLLALNLFRMSIPVSDRDKRLLSKYERNIKVLADKKSRLYKKRSAIIKGGINMVILMARLAIPYL